jgi:hypothetical protein
VEVARKIPFDDPQVLLYVRAAYVIVQVVILGTYYLVSLRVKNYMSLRMHFLTLLAQVKKKNDMTTLKYGEARSPFHVNRN